MDNVFTQRFYFLTNETFNGLLNVSMNREYDQFIIILKLYQFYITEKSILETIRDECNKNPFSTTLLDKVDTKLLNTFRLNYTDIEEYLPILENEIRSLSMDDPDYYQFKIMDSFYIILTPLQVKRFYFDLYSFYSNYFTLEGFFKIFTANNTDKKPSKESRASISQQKQPINEEIEIPVNTTPMSTLDNIMDLCYNDVIKTHIIHQTFTYFRYVSSKHCFINKEDNKTTIYIVPLLPSKYIFTNDYYKSLIMSLSNIEPQDFNQFVNKILTMLTEEENKWSINIMILSYLMFIYSLRYLLYSHPHEFNARFDNWCSDMDMQIRILNHHISIYQKNFLGKLEFHGKNIDVYDIGEYDREQFDHICQEHSYMKRVSEEEYLRLVLKDLNEKEYIPQDFVLNRRKVIDITKPIVKVNSDQYKIFKPIVTDQKVENFLEYNFNKQYITKPFEYLIKYTNDPSIILNIKDVPDTVVKLFENLKQFITPNVLRKENVSTLSYYKLLCDHLPDARSMSHDTILYIIYRIIIPFYYYFYKISRFEDYLMY